MEADNMRKVSLILQVVQLFATYIPYYFVDRARPGRAATAAFSRRDLWLAILPGANRWGGVNQKCYSLFALARRRLMVSLAVSLFIVLFDCALYAVYAR